MSPKGINSAFLVSSRLITDTIFFVCGTFAILGLYILIICTGPLYVWIVITAISELTGCHDYKAKPISLLIIKHICVTAFGLYRN